MALPPLPAPVADGGQWTLEVFLAMLERKAEWAPGPHDKSNWLVEGHVLVGGWPGRLPKGRGSLGETKEEGEAKLQSILDTGVTTFVSLTEEKELRGSCYSYGAFKSTAERLHREREGPLRRQRQAGRELHFLRCPMPDGCATSDQLLLRLLQEVLEEIGNHRRLYVHCYGGHGRTGIVGCALLHLLYGMESDESVVAFNALHGARREPGVGGPGQFPHSEAQREQVCRVVHRAGPFAAIDPALHAWRLAAEEEAAEAET
mmetsp:Transcript_32727/g.74822  ORF Transcript_32727/g.74822 Transcript_32727/m.74822 type:complete len:260 (+) Transcript_32727:56-835(+)